ncbi:MAG: bifunctional diaminohydroxyphosphoribosylaminopyrimidine deaminase/5-amino-6-(5-phosphoribosylamino)uracil reductase RibD [Gemmatimonadetes bacterium]|nr:bifunctional diaminohydroxyphosphoribosylaminopyrimidine deaminase/5-amino-6-(5-phosphoribosylamino)uracil reductase RibD [Gemmatimonadota bacterium]
MDRALALALEGWGQVSPNPLVGAVVVSGGQVAGEGFHAAFGEEHAERGALRESGSLAAGSTLYVTLEPCAHRGKTAACTEAILAAGVHRVVFACRDPDSAAGGGETVLRQAGLEVVAGVRALEAARLNEAFIWDRSEQGPWVSLKLALSLDGRIAVRPGVRTDVTGEETAEFVHRLRARHDAIVVGGRTAVVDDPLLTVRRSPPPRIPPTRVVLDPSLQVSVESRLVASVDEAPLLFLCREDSAKLHRTKFERRGAEVVSVPADRQGLLLGAAMSALRERGLRAILVEGGGRLAGAMLAEGLVRKQYLIYAPVILGPEGVPAIASHTTAERGDWNVVHRAGLGPDTLLEFEDRRARAVLREVV